MTVFILKGAYQEIERHVLSAYPEEGCGVMVGEVPANFGHSDCEIRVSEVRSLKNAWEGSAKTRRYLADDKALAQIEMEYAGKSEGIVGIYHSHPDVAAWPSHFDLERAWPCYAYLILSVRRAKIEDTRVWWLSENSRMFLEGKLKKVQESCFANLASSRK